MVYDTTKVTDELSLEKILTKTNQFSIYKYYISKPIKINKAISSPFRTDRNPSWSIFETKQGDLLYKDFKTGESGGIVKFVQRLFSLSFKEALEKMWEDTVVKQHVKTTKPIKVNYTNKNVSISIQQKYFTNTDKDYWSQYSITKETLKHFKVYPIKHFWIGDKLSNLIYSKLQPMYAYKLFDKFKIYRPYSETKKDKWRTNCDNYDIQGIQQLPETGNLLIITKSLKDVMSLYELGFNAIAPQSEQTHVPTSIMKYLKEKFKDIVVLYDYDEGGIQGAKKLSEKYNLKNTHIPKHYLDLYSIKDVSDCIKEIGIDKTKELLNKLLNE